MAPEGVITSTVLVVSVGVYCDLSRSRSPFRYFYFVTGFVFTARTRESSEAQTQPHRPLSPPPLLFSVSQANTIEVHFHSDASNNDWGVRMHAYGIMQVRNDANTP